MSNTTHTQSHRWFSIIAGLYLFFGVMLLTTSASQILAASLLGPGASVVQTAQIGEASYAPVGSHVPVAMFQNNDIELRLTLGMLLILAGIGFYVFHVIHTSPIGSGFRKVK